jgi:Ca-activated chloride channel family protein
MGLKASDFELRDNGVVQTITDLSQETLPLNVFCVLDLSGSVKGRPLALLKEATNALFGTLRDRDRASLVTFTERVMLHAPLTSDVRRLRGLVEGLKGDGPTSVIDAIFTGLALRETDDGRALMLLFSDGEDTSSWMTAQSVVETARRTDVVIYPVTIKQLSIVARPLTSVSGLPTGHYAMVRDTRFDSAAELLDAFADETGGRVIYAENDEKLQATFVQVLSEFRQRYVLSYSPTNVSGEGWHNVDVTVVGKRAQVKARRGYAAAPTSRGGATRER